MSESSSSPPQLTRRSATKLLGGALLSAALPSPFSEAQQPRTAPAGLNRLLSDDDIAFLEEMEQADPASGQVLDRAVNKTFSGEFDTHFASSIAATGFGLTALCISDRRGYYPTDRLKKQVITTLDFHLNKMPNEHGFYYHLNDVETGKPLVNIEVSSIDTSILLCGVLPARAYFKDPRITNL